MKTAGLRFAVVIVCLVAPFWAAEAAAREDERVLFFTGADMSSISHFVWGGADAALLAPRARSGPVARLVGGVGEYRYDNEEVAGGVITGTVTAGQALLGWRHFAPRMTATALVGAEVEHHALSPADPGNDQAGMNWGARFAGELWWEPADRLVVDANAAYGTAFDGYSARLAMGWRVGERIIAGPEIASVGNRTSGQWRAGLWLAGLSLGRAEFRLAAGAVRDDDGATGAYGSLGAHLAW